MCHPVKDEVGRIQVDECVIHSGVHNSSPKRGRQFLAGLKAEHLAVSGTMLQDGDTLAVVEAVVDELARTAENLRLFNETREQANFESLVSEINQKLRQAPTMDILAKTAAEALGNVLGVSHSLIKVGVKPSSEQPAQNGEKG